MNQLKDRRDAGQRLAKKLHGYKGRNDVVVLGLPRGGVPVAYEIARELDAPLDVFVVRKLGTPGQPELAMGAIASGGIRILNEKIIQSLNIPQTAINDVVEREDRELKRREQTFRGDRDPVPLEDKVVILVDDGLATGASMKAAIEAVHASSPKKLMVAVGTAPRETLREFKGREDVDDVVCLVSPAMFYGVGGSYENFAQTTDDEVRDCLT